MDEKDESLKEQCKKDRVSNKKLWLLPAASLVINLLSNGIERSNGVIFVALMEVEHQGRLISSLPFSIMGLSSIISAPATGFCGHRMTFRAIGIFGQSLVVLGLLASFFSTDVYAITFFMFIRTYGCKFFTTYLNQLMITTFTENKSTAFALSTLGVTLGGFFWPYLSDHLIQNYGFQGSFMLSAGVALHALIPVFLVSCFLSKEVNVDLRKKENNPSPTKEHGENITKSKNEVQIKDPENVSRSLVNNAENFYFETSHNDMKEQNLSVSKELMIQDSKSNSGVEIKFLGDFRDQRNGDASNFEKNEKDSHPVTNYAVEGNLQLQTENERRQTIKENNRDENDSKFSQKRILFNVFTNRGFYLLTLTASLNGYAQNTFFQVIVDYMRDKGAESNLAFSIITIYSFGAIVGRIGLGWVDDRKLVSPQIFKAVTLWTAASSLLIATFTQGYYLQMIFYFIVAATQGFVAVGTFTYFREYFEKHEILIAISSLSFIRGFFQLARIPLIGFFRDYLKNYDYLFETTSIMFYTLGFMWSFEHYILQKKKKAYIAVPTDEKEAI